MRPVNRQQLIRMWWIFAIAVLVLNCLWIFGTNPIPSGAP